MKSMKQIISILLTLAMVMSMITIPTLAEEAEIEKVITDNTVLTEPFDVTNEEEVDAGLYPYDEKTVLVKFAKKTKTLDVDGIASIEYLFKAKDGFWYTAHLADGTTPKMAIEDLRSTSSVLVAEYNFLYETGATTLCDNEGVSDDVKNNGKSKDQWHLDSCGFQKAWKKLKNDKKNPGGDSGIVVAVIDTGVDYDHEDLKNNMWTNVGEVPGDGIDNDKNGYVDDYYGVNIVAKKGNGDDDHGHGTHVAGIIAAGNNNVGVVGLAYNTKIMAIKAGQASGYFLNTDVCKAIDYARENGADVINMSFGSTATTIAVQDALEEAYTHSVLVAAAGNDGMYNEGLMSKPCYPAAYSFVLGVMAVDDFGVESAFTNWDVIGFNSVEYELYAPGNAITSTIPNDKYATWNGTSMAAPIVSAMAAVLRSVYNDPDMYPTKFIYGQLASTSERHAECLDPKLHGPHNLQQIANLYDALYKMPKPDVSLSEYKTFDTSDIDKNNNGDGTIDSGETISLGFELRNRWGMSEDTIVTIDAKSQADIPNPYVEFSTDGKNFSKSASIDYGGVGTYSTQDCGKIIENDLWTGWENPFYVKVAKDAPNNTILAINVTIACKNALDEEDKSTYSSNATIELIVKNGIVLPQIIDEDMTLTKDNYYIIQNATVIESGATVTVTEGTNIQFWTSDSTDPYADKYMAGLVVKGVLNCVGTEEEPVKIFPSDLMRRYRVEIYESGNGAINYNYTNLTNLYTGTGTGLAYGFTTANNCEFNQNHKSVLYSRYLDAGEVKVSTSGDTYIKGGKAKESAFYKMGTDKTYYDVQLSVNCENCIFVDSYIDFDESYAYKDCVFYGNNNYWDSTTTGGVSTFGTYTNNAFKSSTAQKIVRDETTGKVYLQVTNLTTNIAKKLAEYLGGGVAYIETQNELNFLLNSGLSGSLGAENKEGEFYWFTGEKIGDFITLTNPTTNYAYLYLNNGKISKTSSYSQTIIELPGDIYIEELSLLEKSVTLDTADTYQIEAQIYPSLASMNKLLYFSSNEAVMTVDENGIVTPVDRGVATVYVFSEDMQVSASMEIVVEEEVKVADLIAPKEMYIDIGNKKPLGVTVYPADTTKKVTYESSDESVVTVDENGNITAVSEGTATITVMVSNNNETFEATTTVYSYSPITEIITSEKVYIDLDSTKTLDVEMLPTNSIKKVIYESSDENIVEVDENGNLTSVSEGTATITITAFNDNENIVKTVTVYSYEVATEIISPEVVYIDIGNTKELNTVLSPAHVVKHITYESSDESVVTVDENGNITAVSEGTATITATVKNDDGSSYSTVTTVMSAEKFTNIDFPKEMFVDIGNTKALDVVPSLKKATYESNNENIVAVDENGNITSISEGSTIITIKVFNDEETVSANIIVHSYPPATGITAPDVIYMDSGSTIALNASINPINTVKKVTYESSDEGIVTVDNDGNIKSKSQGTAVITATVYNDNESYEVKTTVHNYAKVTSATVPSAMYIDLGDTMPLNVKLSPANVIKKVIYQSSNEDVVTVDEEGNVTSISEGRATITTTVYNATYSFTKTTTVYSYPAATGMTAPETMRVSLNSSSRLNVKFTPENTVKLVTYESSDESIATVDSSGYIKGKRTGFVTITAKHESGDTYFETHTLVQIIIPTESIEIEDDYIITKLSEETYIIPEMTPSNATFKNYTWESSDESVCYVDENGKLIKNGVGVANLTVKQDEYYLREDSITVVVTSDDFTENDKDIIDIKTVNATTSYALLEDNTIWKWDTSYSQYGQVLLAEKLNIDFDGTIDDFFVGEDAGKIFILSGTTMYESNQLNKGIISDFVVSKGFTGSVVDDPYLTLDDVYSMYSFGNKCYIAAYETLSSGSKSTELFVNSGYSFGNSESVYADDIYIDNYYDINRGQYVDSNMFVYDYPDVYIEGYYNGMYYDYSDYMKILTDISKINGGYASDYSGYSYVLGDSTHTSINISSDHKLSRLTSEKYISHYVDEYNHNRLYMNYYNASSVSELVEQINNDEHYEYSDIVMENIDQIFDVDNINVYHKEGYYEENCSSFYYETTDHQLFAWDCENKPYQVVFGMEYEDELYDETSFNLEDVVMDENGDVTSSVLKGNEISICFNATAYETGGSDIERLDGSYVYGRFYGRVDGNKITYNIKSAIDRLVIGEQYRFEISVKNSRGITESIDIIFTYQPKDEESSMIETYSLRENRMASMALFSMGETAITDGEHIHSFTTETVMPTLESEGIITNVCDCGLTTETTLPQMTERKMYSAEDYANAYEKFIKTGYNTYFTGNAILNRLIDDDVTKWFRITATSGTNKYGFGGNYWGTTNSELINHQIVDYNDYVTLGDIIEGEFLEKASENTFPFVTEAYLTDESGEVMTVISGGKVKFVVKFNRDMDTEYGLNVYFGSTYPYADYEIYGDFEDARTWVGETELKTVIENGYQFIRVTNGRTAADENAAHLKLYDDWARFGFEIDTTSAMAMMMQGYADNDGIHLEWMQDDYETLAGYNVYRATSENGNYVRINKTIIPSDENTFTDTDVEPGKKYYYTFTVVLTDATDSKPAGKISVTAKDTMAPSVYHSPVYTATTGNKVIISATVSDNIGVQNAKLYYRVKGTDEWKTADMSKSNSKYTASIPAAFVTTEGVEYYIAAFDGVNYTYAGSHTSENPYEITVYQAVENNAKGDVDGDGNITVLDALKLLRAIYDESLLTQEEFLRADINGDGSLSAVEALRILQYANKTISSVLW